MGEDGTVDEHLSWDGRTLQWHIEDLGTAQYLTKAVMKLPAVPVNVRATVLWTMSRETVPRVAM